MGVVMGDLFTSGIRPTIDEWLLNKSKEIRDYQDYWSASSAGYCMRRVIFERLGVPKIESDGDARKQRVFTSGHIFHEWIQGITKEAGLSIAQELELQDEGLMIRGHIDDLVLVTDVIKIDNNVLEAGSVSEKKVRERVMAAQHLILYDYKTQNSGAFTWDSKKKAQALPTLKHTHKMQLGTYLYMLRKYPGVVGEFDPAEDYHEGAEALLAGCQNLTEARILKISKDDLRMAEEQLLWSPQLEKEVYEYWSTLNGYWKSKKLPKCTCHVHDDGFMAKEAYNGYFYKGEPCSLGWYEHAKKTELFKVRA